MLGVWLRLRSVLAGFVVVLTDRPVSYYIWGRRVSLHASRPCMSATGTFRGGRRRARHRETVVLLYSHHDHGQRAAEGSLVERIGSTRLTLDEPTDGETRRRDAHGPTARGYSGDGTRVTRGSDADLSTARLTGPVA